MSGGGNPISTGTGTAGSTPQPPSTGESPDHSHSHQHLQQPTHGHPHSHESPELQQPQPRKGSIDVSAGVPDLSGFQFPAFQSQPSSAGTNNGSANGIEHAYAPHELGGYQSATASSSSSSLEFALCPPKVRFFFFLIRRFCGRWGLLR